MSFPLLMLLEPSKSLSRHHRLRLNARIKPSAISGDPLLSSTSSGSASYTSCTNDLSRYLSPSARSQDGICFRPLLKQRYTRWTRLIPLEVIESRRIIPFSISRLDCFLDQFDFWSSSQMMLANHLRRSSHIWLFFQFLYIFFGCCRTACNTYMASLLRSLCSRHFKACTKWSKGLLDLVVG